MNNDLLMEDIKDSIVDVISNEYYYTKGGLDTKYFLPTIELVLTAIVSAFLIPYLKKLAELAAEDTYKKIKNIINSKDENGFMGKSTRIISLSPLSVRASAEVPAKESLLKELDKHNFSEETQEFVLKKILNHIQEIKHMDD